MRILRISYLAVLIPLFIIGCCSTKCGNKFTEYNISWGEGGGATGRWSGYTIDSESKELSKWQGMIQADKPEKIKKLCKKNLKKISDEIKTADLININFQEPSNRSYYIKVTQSGKSNVILWNPTAENETITKLNKFYDFLNKYTK